MGGRARLPDLLYRRAPMVRPKSLAKPGTRRRFLQGTGAALGLSTLPLLPACGGGDPEGENLPTPQILPLRDAHASPS